MSNGKKLLAERVQIIRGSAGSFAVKSAGAALALVVQIVLARVLGADEYGIYSYVMAWITFAALIAPLGADKSAVRFIPAYVSKKSATDVRSFVSWAYTQTFASSLLIMILGAFIIISLKDRMAPALFGAILIACLIIPINAITQVGTEIVRSFRKVVRAELPNLLLRPLIVGAVAISLLPILTYSPNATDIIIVNIIAGLTAAAILAAHIKRLLPMATDNADPRDEQRTWIKGSLALLVVVFSNFVLGRTDILMLGVMAGTTEAGLYNAAARVSGLVGFPMIAVASILTPTLSHMHAAGRSGDLQAVLTLGAWLSVAAAAVAGGATIFGAEFILSLFGESFRSETFTLTVLVIGQFVCSLAGAVGYLLAVSGWQTLLAAMTGAAAIVNALLNLLLIPKYGSTGAALATATTLGLYNLILAAVAFRYLGLNTTILSGLPKQST